MTRLSYNAALQADRHHRAVYACDVWSRDVRYYQGELGGRLGAKVMEWFRRWFTRPADQRRAQQANFAQTGYHHQRYLARVLSLAHKRPVLVTGEATAADWWPALRDSARWDSAFQRKSHLFHGIGSCAIRPTWDDAAGREPGLQVLPPTHWIALGTAARPEEPLAVFEPIEPLPSDGGLWQSHWIQHGDWAGRPVRVWSVEDPRDPVYGVWPSVQAFLRGQASSDSGQLLRGSSYPWWMGASPVLLHTVYRAGVGAEEVNDLGPFTTLVMALQTWAHFGTVTRGWPIPVVGTHSQKGGAGADPGTTTADQGSLLATPLAVLAMRNVDLLGKVESAVPDAKARLEIIADMAAQAAEVHEKRLVRQRDATSPAASGVALSWDAAQEGEAFEEQATAWAALDAGAVQRLLIVRNEQVAAGLLPGPVVPVGDITVQHRYRKGPQVLREEAARELQLFDKGASDLARLRLAMQGREATPENLRSVLEEFEREGDGILALRERLAGRLADLRPGA
ncbi:MAG TPA: hypothetical protein VEI97_14610 [bacterium]|nr:hypothetical protein [bacterium]